VRDSYAIHTARRVAAAQLPGPRTFATDRIANNAAPTMTNSGCLGRNVRTPVKRKDDFALVTIVSLLAGAIGVALELVGYEAVM